MRDADDWSRGININDGVSQMLLHGPLFVQVITKSSINVSGLAVGPWNTARGTVRITTHLGSALCRVVVHVYRYMAQ